MITSDENITNLTLNPILSELFSSLMKTDPNLTITSNIDDFVFPLNQIKKIDGNPFEHTLTAFNL
mgnify:CR=1 FL=1